MSTLTIITISSVNFNKYKPLPHTHTHKTIKYNLHYNKRNSLQQNFNLISIKTNNILINPLLLLLQVSLLIYSTNVLYTFTDGVGKRLDESVVVFVMFRSNTIRNPSIFIRRGSRFAVFSMSSSLNLWYILIIVPEFNVNENLSHYFN